MNFSDALQAIKSGKRVCRKGWNGAGQWVELIPTNGATHHGFPLCDCIGIKNAQNQMQPGWLASQGDLLAEDWEILFEG